MSHKNFDWYGWGLTLLSSAFLGIVVVVFSFVGLWLLGLYRAEAGIFVLDAVSFSLCVLSLFLGCSLIFVAKPIGFNSKLLLVSSIVSSLFTYFCVNGLWFWIFYEMSIFPLLFLLVLESPYSERYVASWYLLGYVVFSSLPMLLCILCIGGMVGTYDFQVWFLGGQSDNVFLVYILLAVMFITKIPLVPFYIWLPIVHAEASSPVSVLLSGFVMKLGLLGVLRFCYSVLSEYVFSGVYIVICLSFAVLFFFSASRELDGKRWLAFLSLAHIVIAAVCMNLCYYDNACLSFYYSLGHGLSAGVTFLFLWLVYEACGSRNWAVLKSYLSSGLFMRCLMVGCVCSAASIPPTVNFFSEVLILCDSAYSGFIFVLLMSIYLFVGGLVPVFLVGCLLTRHCSLSFGCGSLISYFGSVVFLMCWCYALFLVF
uniref:NADH-ubiquinone oxidoreductase chain 4 n=1 Tax=Echinostoma hortense TaxID=48216 RepID=A0A0M4JTQ2_9TREM|nr:NADH dehydrogenase subunit 4 [Echinostoma hortense]